MKKRTDMLAADRRALGKKLAAFLKADHAELARPGGGVHVQTKAGDLWVHFDEQNYGAIFCRFEDPDAARRVLHGGETIYPGGGQRLNPYSGKWNFHFGAWTADEAFSLFEHEFKKVAP